MSTLGVVVTGATGRMGGRIIHHLHDIEGVALVAATDRPGSSHVGLDAGLAAGIGAVEIPVHDVLTDALDAAGERARVIIDFTTAEASAVHAAVAAERGLGLVVGSTGFDDATRAAVEAAATKVPVVMAPNMSTSVNLMIALSRIAAEVLGDEYDVEILEAHHRGKKDAPSGTALRLGEVVAKALGREFGQVGVFGRRGNVGERPRREIGVHALRGSDVVGEHTVYYFGDGDRLEITHRAGSRDTFARGAVRAARWVAEQPAGLYGMAEVLGFGS
ncbi:MAG: 4-hydroxy-tetrahydrodipicolinate reductase [Deltaproteobacteria bacterium]|nr:4-hydroxy-tetrahydrodipicolinate reductase [Deltaproteobacteria bacterium]